MKFQNYIIPLFVGSNLLGQSEVCLAPKISLGFSHSTYTSLSFSTIAAKPVFKNEERNIKRESAKLIEIQYGFGIGAFLWMPLSEFVVFKPQIEGSFTNTCVKQTGSVYATSFDASFSQGFLVYLDKPNANGILHLAKDMSCYLASKQPYFLIGPKVKLKKYDSGYINKGYQNELNFGGFIGYGINCEFHGTSVAPEICYSICATGQNEYDGAKKIAHTITLTLNFF